MKLSEFGESLAYDIAFWMAGTKDPAYPIEQLGKLSLKVSEKLRALAIIVLLTKGESDRYYHNLIRSGLVWETYLRRCRSEGFHNDHHYASGRYAPFVDAVAAGDFVLARRISELSPEEWRQGHEYEDDYCYAQILHRLIQETLEENEISGFLARFEAYLDGQPSARLGVCRSLADRSQEHFDEAFAGILDERRNEIAEEKQGGRMEDAHGAAEQRVFVEGLALLRIAEALGLTTQPDYRYCPSLARSPMRTPFPGE